MSRAHLRQSLRAEASKHHDRLQTFEAEVETAFELFRDVAVSLEKDNAFESVSENVEGNVKRLMSIHADLRRRRHALKKLQTTVKDVEDEKELLEMDFSGAIADEIKRIADEGEANQTNRRAAKRTADQLRRLRRAVHDVHHEGEALPGEEDDDIAVLQADAGEAQFLCPIDRCAFVEPVRNEPCGHTYSKANILEHIRVFRRSRQDAKCPVAGCNHTVEKDNLVPDRRAVLEAQRSQRRKKRDNQSSDDDDDDDDEEESRGKRKKGKGGRKKMTDDSDDEESEEEEEEEEKKRSGRRRGRSAGGSRIKAKSENDMEVDSDEDGDDDEEDDEDDEAPRRRRGGKKGKKKKKKKIDLSQAE